MCRTGGRRCPGQSTPEGRATRNARRRAQYAAKKAATSGANIGQDSDIVTFSDSSPKIDSLADKMAFEENRAVDSVGTSGDGPFNLVMVPQKNPFTNPAGVLEHAITGTIDYSKLDDESYQYFGFTKYEDDRIFSGYEGYEPSLDMSREETYGLDRTEEDVVQAFTNSAYLFMNEYAFDHSKIDSLPDQSELEGKMGWCPEDELMDRIVERGAVFEGTRSRQALKSLTQVLDGALLHGAGVQRRVYRGIGASEIEREGDIKHVDKWVDEHRSVGTIVSFDGYTSSSTSAETANDFACSVKQNKRVVYEIITPQGLSVECLTSSSNENEVILPREQKYAVVGVQKDIDRHKRLIVVQMIAVNSKGEILDGTNADPVESLFK